jgi:hypothetical protein
MKYILAALMLLASPAFAQYIPGVQVGVITGTNGTAGASVALVTPTPATMIFVCNPITLPGCWPQTPGQAQSILLGTAPPSTPVWTGAAWTTVGAITAASVTITATTTTLTWKPPTLNTDGSALTGPVTYKVYQGTTVLASGLTGLSYAIPTKNLAVGTYQWSVSAVVGGQESTLTGPIIGVVAAKVPATPTGLTITFTLSQ